MEIILTKGKNKNTLTCKRQDGSVTSSSLGPNVPNHDFAHFVAENKFKLEEGFFGNIKAGKSIAELSDPELIQDLSPETWLSEILARNLQSLRSGAVKTQEFAEIIKWESEKIDGIKVPEIDFSDVNEMKQEFDSLCEKWNLMRENEDMKLLFE